MPRKVRDCMLGFDAPFNPLRVKGAHGRGRKERKTDSKDDSDGPGGDGADLAAMQELLGGLPRLPREVHHLMQFLWTLRLIESGCLISPTHDELREDLEKEKKKR
ncbi:hypothetical protein HAX54_035751 [Datura stramonium]|uniref:Uncharacterized protein n=1 Tax=Datura stramonium TaxID=4076 RepID=A0ABS8SFW1_DATST|nr:hypothetical protein [Datura stramonium]